jgi:quinohemoprotein ethanol dehydrogenase
MKMRTCLLLLVLGSALRGQARYEDILKGPGEDWLTYAGSYEGWRYSPLKQISVENAASMAPKWVYHVPNATGLRSSPIVYKGVMYVTNSNALYAIDARSGRLIWQYEDTKAKKSGVNRGAAILGDSIYFTTSDNYLVALDRQTGSPLFSRRFADAATGTTSASAPLIVKDKILVGSAGGDSGMRGFIAALSPKTGDEIWRTFTIPAKGEPGSETWSGLHEWGGAGTWLSGTFDPQSNTLFWTTGNPWPDYDGTPRLGEDLYTCSLIALDLDTGRMRWYFQFTPHDTHDWDAQSWPVLLEIPWQDKKTGVTAPRKVVVHANRNGFFYVLDRVTGELLAADKFVDANWATHIDLKTGRPVESPDADYTKGKPVIVFPSAVGAHNFNPMSLSARTGLVYIPAANSGMALLQAPRTPYLKERGGSGVQIAFATQLLAPPATLPPALRPVTAPSYLKKVPRLDMYASLKAWDPVARKVVWEHRYASFMDHGGVLSTAGGVVIQGSIDGKLRVFNDETGEVIKEIDTGSPLIAAPMTYTVNGAQYVAILAGSGGGGWTFWMPGNVATERGNDNRILVFRLDGGATPVPPALPAVLPIPEPPAQPGTPTDIAAGAVLFGRNCAGCHANADRAPVPDLRRSGLIRESSAFQAVVRGGALEKRGMPSWDDLLTEAEVEQIRAHLVSVARDAYSKQRAGASSAPAPAMKQGHL